jgi:hypothetical protein
MLQRKPSVMLGLGRRPNFPNNFVEVGLNKPQKLHLIGGRRRVMPIGGELPRDIVLNIFPEMYRLDVGPKLHKLRKMFD